MDGPGGRNRLIRIAATLLVAPFIFAVFASGMDRISASAPGMERVVPRQFRADAARSAGELALVRGDAEGALRAAIQAVRHDPVDPHSVALLATAKLQKNDYDGAYAAYRVAALFGWRDRSTQLYWYGQALAVGDWNVAMDRADAILRTSPSIPGANDILAPFENDPAGRKALLRHIAERPKWIDAYLNPPRNASPELWDRRVTVLAELGKSGAGLGCASVSPFVERLLADARRRQAEEIWNANCPENATRGLLADPDLRLVDRQVAFPFGWIVRRNGDVSVRREGSDKQALLVLNNGAPSTRQVLYQAVALPPGRYRIQAEGAETIQPRKLEFTYSCADTGRSGNEQRVDPAGSGQVFNVGACRRQQVALWVRAGAGDIKLRSVRLARIG